jgi:predicted nucleic acid-binding protein
LQQTGTGRLSTQALAEFVNAVMRKLDPPLSAAHAKQQGSLFATAWPILDLTPQIVLEAARGVRDHGMSYYDAQTWATARLNQIPVILSEDFRAGQILEGVRFVNPFAEALDVEAWL